jgi:monovalent cation:H+ antiporter, CPA1 family
MHFLIGWSWIDAALFGVLIAAADSVSVIASFAQGLTMPYLIRRLRLVGF